MRHSDDSESEFLFLTSKSNVQSKPARYQHTKPEKGICDKNDILR